ncbi:MAG: YutD family protein [Bacillales bacterium]|nr:YutD family protein [Bacillales bacterium]
MKTIKINGTLYTLERNYKDGFDLTEVENKLTDYFDGYDYIFGDWSYGKLRLKGFMEEKKSNKINNIKFIDDYIKKYCSYECKYFLLKKVNKE